MKRKLFRLAVMLLSLLTCPPGHPLMAQEYRGRVQGIVTDASGGVVAGARVELVNTQTGISAMRISDAQGRYLFDLVQPGRYNETVEMQGFDKTIHADILVQERSDVTVDTTLKIGSISNQIQVQAASQGIEFNSAKVETVLNSQQVADLPNYDRNPFLLALVNPAVVDTRPYNSHPYDTWGSNALSIGGGPQFSNDLQVDGSPITLGLKSTYVPNTDAVQELSVQQNAVDAEFGHSAGGIVSLALKSGTNQFHGEVFYRGHYPWLNALQDRTAPIPSYSLEREHYMGGTLGNPIIRNRLFNFASFEYQYRSDPSTTEYTLPSNAELSGDFSQSLNANGGLRTIYDPTTTSTDASGNISRQPFSGNVIPANRIDPVALQLSKQLWSPNNAGVGFTHQNNYFLNAPQLTLYKNFMDRVDYNITDRMQLNAYTGYYSAPVGAPQGGPNSPLYVAAGSITQGKNDSIGFTYTLNPHTVLDIGGEYHTLLDAANWPTGSTKDGFAQYYPNNNWYNTLTIPGIGLSPFAPSITINSPGSGLSFGTPRGYYYSNPYGWSMHGKLGQQIGAHFLKYGADYRYDYAASAVDWNSGFAFFGNTTASTYVNPDLGRSGDAWASFLTGALGDPADYNSTWSPTTLMAQNILNTPYSRFYSLFANDDWKVARNLTVTMGLRYEYETPWMDSQNRLSRGPDLSAPLPALAQNPPAMPTAISQYYSGTPQWTGAWQFATSGHRGGWNSLGNVFLPRFGAAYRLNDKTAITGAWARWAQPWIQTGYGAIGSFLDYVYPGFSATQQPAPMINGVPQVFLSNPFPVSNPIVPAPGKSLGVYSQVGNDGIDVAYQNRKKALSDRFNFGLQRQLPANMVLKATYFFNYTHNLGYNWNANMIDPRLLYQYGGTLNSLIVDNPFYNYLTPQTFPGPLRYQQTLPALSLMRPYPQYGNITEEQKPGASSRYHEINLSLNRQFQNGLTFMFAYDYNNETDSQFFNDVATYLQHFTWIPAANTRHRISGTFVWDTPFGRGRQFFTDMPRVTDLLIGGWNISGILTWHSGDYLNFQGDPLLVDSSCNVNATPHGYWFNTSCFSQLPAFTERKNPWIFAGLTGPSFFNLDATLFKEFSFSERIKAKVHVSAFNAFNNLNLGDPDLNLFDQLFGQSIYQASNLTGRRLELGMKLLF